MSNIKLEEYGQTLFEELQRLKKMKRSRFLFNQIIDFENIRLAWLKAKLGKTFSYAVTAFNKDVNDNLEK